MVQVVNLLTTEGHTDKSLKNEIEILQMLQGCRLSILWMELFIKVLPKGRRGLHCAMFHLLFPFNIIVVTMCF